jgi:error-prone DNA polymerase
MATSSVLPAYAELQCFSHYTFLRGASSPEQLVARAATLGYHALAIVDECTVAGVVKAHVAAKELGLKLLIGRQITVTPRTAARPSAC